MRGRPGGSCRTRWTACSHRTWPDVDPAVRAPRQPIRLDPMDIDIIAVPFDSAHRGVRMGAGPEAILAAGLPDRLARSGHRVTCLPVELPEGSWRAEIRTAFDLAGRIAERVRAARAGG